MPRKMPHAPVDEGEHPRRASGTVGELAQNVVHVDGRSRVERARCGDATRCTGKYPSRRVPVRNGCHDGVRARGDICWRLPLEKLDDSDGKATMPDDPCGRERGREARTRRRVRPPRCCTASK